MGFLIAWFDGRGTQSRGKAFKDAVYGKLGVVEIDDQAAGAKFLMQRPYVQGVGVYGTSYGGYASVMCILRHPDVFNAAVASSAVTK
jgi:dipeptidyl-peptidase-4